jgi:hypothetical protein
VRRGANADGVGITGTPQGLEIQCEGHDVRLDLKEPNTHFAE